MAETLTWRGVVAGTAATVLGAVIGLAGNWMAQNREDKRRTAEHEVRASERHHEEAVKALARALDAVHEARMQALDAEYGMAEYVDNVTAVMRTHLQAIRARKASGALALPSFAAVLRPATRLETTLARVQTVARSQDLCDAVDALLAAYGNVSGTLHDRMAKHLQPPKRDTAQSLAVSVAALEQATQEAQAIVAPAYHRLHAVLASVGQELEGQAASGRPPPHLMSDVAPSPPCSVSFWRKNHARP
jgi:hypothetical protein